MSCINVQVNSSQNDNVIINPPINNNVIINSSLPYNLLQTQITNINNFLTTGNFGGQTGIYIFATNINSGINEQFISFPTIFNGIPKVVSSLNTNYSSNIFLQQASGISTSGFFALFTDIIDNSGYYLDSVASL